MRTDVTQYIEGVKKLQNLYKTITGDSGSTEANISTDSLAIVGGINVTTTVTNDTVTIDSTGTPDQDLWATFTADTGSATANSTTDSFDFAGGVGIITAISGDVATFTLDLNELTTETSIAAGDFIAMVDITDSGSGKITFANFEGTLNLANLTGTIDISSQTNLAVSDTTTIDMVLTGDTLSANGLYAGSSGVDITGAAVTLDINGLPTGTLSGTDELAFFETSGAANEKITAAAFKTFLNFQIFRTVNAVGIGTVIADDFEDTLNLDVGTAGTDFNLTVDSGTDTITFNIPDASVTNRGLVTTGTQEFDGTKTFDNTTIHQNGLQILAATNLIMTGSTASYRLRNSGAVLDFEATGAGDAQFQYFAGDGDGTDDVKHKLYGVGAFNGLTNTEFLEVGYEATGTQFEISTQANGTGTLRDLILYTEGNTDQLKLDTNGNVIIGSMLQLFTGTSITTNAAGEIALDTDGNGSTITTGVLQMYDGTQNTFVVSATNYPTTDNDVPAYDSASNSVLWQAQTGVGDNLGDHIATQTLNMDANDIQMQDSSQVIDSSENELLGFFETADAINYLQVTNAAEEDPPILSSVGDDTNIGLSIRTKGTGLIDFYSAYEFPAADGTANQYLETDGSGNLTFTSLPVASTTVSGIQENAVASEVTTGSSATLTVTPDALRGSEFAFRIVTLVLVDDETDLTVKDGIGDITWTVPDVLNGFDLVRVAASVESAGTTGTQDIQINNRTQTVDMLTTKITIDSGELDSYTAATPPVIDTANDDVATGDKIRIDSDAIQTTAAKGLQVILIFAKP